MSSRWIGDCIDLQGAMLKDHSLWLCCRLNKNSPCVCPT